MSTRDRAPPTELDGNFSAKSAATPDQDISTWIHERDKELAAGFDRASNWLGAAVFCGACVLPAFALFGIAGAIALGITAIVSYRTGMKTYRTTKAEMTKAEEALAMCEIRAATSAADRSEEPSVQAAGIDMPLATPGGRRGAVRRR